MMFVFHRNSVKMCLVLLLNNDGYLLAWNISLSFKVERLGIYDNVLKNMFRIIGISMLHKLVSASNKSLREIKMGL